MKTSINLVRGRLLRLTLISLFMLVAGISATQAQKKVRLSDMPKAVRDSVLTEYVKDCFYHPLSDKYRNYIRGTFRNAYTPEGEFFLEYYECDSIAGIEIVEKNDYEIKTEWGFKGAIKDTVYFVHILQPYDGKLERATHILVSNTTGSVIYIT